MYLLYAARRTLSPAAKRRAACAGLTGVALAATACGGSAPSVTLPHKAPAATVTPAALSGPDRTPRQMVAAAYRGYWRAYAAAMTSGNAARARAIMAPYQVSSGLAQLVGTLKADWAAHDVAYGGAVTHVKRVHIAGTRALLHDCLDLSHFGVLDKATGRVIPDSFGLPELNYYITLIQTGNRWRVSNMQQVEVPCKP